MTGVNVAVLGTGIMGEGMARQLLAAGHRVAVWNRTAARAAQLVAAGATLAETPAQAARDAACVVAMLADNAASRAAWLGDEGALAAMPPGAVAVDCSTLHPDWVRDLAVAMAAAGIGFVEAPVTGSKAQAASGSLRFLVGADDAALAAARPFLAVMGQDVVHLGPVGSGAVLKLANNYLCGVQAASFAQALALIEASGMDRDGALGVLRGGAPGSPIINAMADRMVARAYAPNFYVPLMNKDLTYAGDLLASGGLDPALARDAAAQFARAADAGWAEADIAAVVEPMRRAKGDVA